MTPVVETWLLHVQTHAYVCVHMCAYMLTCTLTYTTSQARLPDDIAECQPSSGAF